jgi:hypothetical protein
MFANVLVLGDVAIFTTNVDAENQTLINHKSPRRAKPLLPAVIFFIY